MSKIYTKPPSFFEHNPLIIIKYLAIFFAALLLLASCSPSKNISYSGDYTKNKSRSTAQRSTSSYKKTNSRKFPIKKKPSIAGNSSSSSKSKPATKNSSSFTKKTSTKSAYTAPIVTSPASPGSIGIRSSIVSYAKKFVGIKYEYGGRDASGFDCSGFTCHVMKKFNLPIPPTSTTQYINGSKISWNKAETGDLIFFGKGGNVSHVGIVSKNTGAELFVIHSTSSRGVCIDEIRHNNYWRPRIIGAASYVNQPTFNARSAGK